MWRDGQIKQNQFNMIFVGEAEEAQRVLPNEDLLDQEADNELEVDEVAYREVEAPEEIQWSELATYFGF